jgi:hypothetical protein
VEANTFLSGDAPHSVSMWFNSSNLVSNASNSCIFSLGTEERLDHVSATFSNNYQTVQKLLASDGVAGDAFGAGNNNNSVSMSGDGSVVVVGSKNHNSLSGAVYIFMKDANGQWKEVQKLLASDGAGGDLFGAGVDISSDGNYIAIGAESAHSTDGNDTGDVGKLYIFKRSVGTNSWSEQQILSSNYESENDNFGRRVSISSDGTYVVTAAQGDDEIHDNAGAGYVFKRTNDTTWNTTPFRLITNDIAQDDNIATSLEISNDGNFIALGVMYDDDVLDRSGSVYMFARTGDNTWVQQDKLTGTPIGIAYFGGQNQGVSLSSDGIYLIVGSYARSSSSGVGSSGAIYFFQRSGSSTTDWAWSLMGDIRTDPTGATGNLFGRAVKMSPDGTTALAHSRDDVSVSTAGAVFVYKRSGSTWTYKYKLQHSDQTAADLFGSALGISTDGSYIVAGSWQDDDLGTDAGAAYIFTRDTTHHLTTDLKLQSNTWHNLTYAYQGEGGSRVTYLDGRKVAEDQAEDTFGEYPPFAMTGYSQGGYVVSASSFNAPNYPPWEAFDDDITDLNNVWHTPGADYSGTDQVYNGSDNFQLSSNTDFGHWIKIEMPHKLIVSHLGLRARIDGYESQAPEDFQICGSNDDVNWDILADINGASPQDDGSSYYVVNSNKGYRYHAIVCSKSVNATVVVIQNLKFYGHRENDLVRLPDPTNVLKYPHIAMTGPAQRGYVVSATNLDVTLLYPAHSAFDEETGTEWLNLAGRYDANGDHTGGETTQENSNIWTGDWLQIQTPNKIRLTSTKIARQSNAYGEYRSPRQGVILGSNNGTTWNYIHNWSGLEASDWPGGGVYREFTFTTPSDAYYKYYRLIVEKNQVGNYNNHISIGSWQLYGTEEAIPVPIQIGGGNIDKVANFRVYDKFVGEDQALEIWDAQKDAFGRAKSSMTLQKGRLGIGTTEPQGRLAVLDEPHNLEEFPPRAMQSSKVSINARTGYYDTHFEGHGTFTAYGSHEYVQPTDARVAWKAFSKQTGGNSTNFGYMNSGNHYTSGGTIYTGPESNGGKRGDFLGLKFPYKVKITHFFVMSFVTSTSSRGPKEGYLLGRINGGDWQQVHFFQNKIFKALEYTKFEFENDTFYDEYILVVTKTTGATVWNASELRYFGTREQGQSVLHDGQLTLTKNLNVPRIGPPIDADDTPRRDRLVVEYNTSTNPTFEGAVRDTSGRGFHGALFGGAYYDATEKALRFDGSGDYTEVQLPSHQVKGEWIHSVSCWVKADVINGEEAVWNIGDRTGQASGIVGSASTLAFNNLSPTLRWYFYNADAHTSNFTVATGQWYHITCVYTGGVSSATSQTIYVNGVEYVFNIFAGAGGALNFDANRDRILMLGRLPWSGSSDFDGSISNFKLYDCALTASEVKTLYDMGRNGSVVNPQPLHIAAPLYSPGTIVQVEQAVKTDTSAVTSTSVVDIGGLSVDITPKFSTSKILVSYIVNVGVDITGTSNMHGFLRVKRTQGGISTYIGDGASSGDRQVCTSYIYNTLMAQLEPFSFEHLDDANGTGTVTYTIQGLVESGVYTMTINRSGSDGDNGYYGRTTSSITVKEVCQ